MILALLLLAAGQQRFEFTTSQSSEVIAELRLSSPGSDWAARGREAAVVSMKVDDRPEHHLIAFGGSTETVYRVGLGRLPAGKHTLALKRDEKNSALGSGLRIAGASFHEVAMGHPDYAIHANMPVLFLRKNTAGKFSDIPLLAYCERLQEKKQRILQYTIIFSNEDGGTSTRALMARWGRTTDIEYIYRVYLDDRGEVARRTVQGRDHKEVEYKGKQDGSHPLLMPMTDNNMMDEATVGTLRFQLSPHLVSLDQSSREQVMDDAPVTYAVSAKELERENKLRQFGVQSGENISDPRNYAYFEYLGTHHNSALAIAVHLENGRAYSSDLGRPDFTIARDGWVRTAVELPPGTKPAGISGIELRCSVALPAKNEPLPHSGRCRIDRVSKTFFLDEQYVPGAAFWKLEDPVTLDSGQSAVFRP
jgi:hypothetical protein